MLEIIRLSVVGIGENLCVCVNGVVIENVNVIYNEWYESVNVEEMEYVSVLNDMIDLRDGLGSCVILKTDDVNFIINDICTN